LAIPADGKVLARHGRRHCGRLADVVAQQPGRAEIKVEMTALVAPFDLVQRTCAKTRRQFDPGDSG
jgi:hypothetical protein